jgi:hypothetical protein
MTFPNLFRPGKWKSVYDYDGYLEDITWSYPSDQSQIEFNSFEVEIRKRFLDALKTAREDILRNVLIVISTSDDEELKKLTKETLSSFDTEQEWPPVPEEQLSESNILAFLTRSFKPGPNRPEIPKDAATIILEQYKSPSPRL